MTDALPLRSSAVWDQATSHMLYPNIAHLLWDASSRGDLGPAVIEPGSSTSYPELIARASSYCAAIRAVGLDTNDRAAVFLERGADAAAAFFGIEAAGAIAVQLAESLRPRQIEYILSHSGARVLVTSRAMLQRLPRQLSAQVQIVDSESVSGESHCQPVPRIGSDVAHIIYTSGSTGLPKGVTVSHANMWAGMQAVVSYVGITSDDRVASLLPFSFDYGFNQLLCALGARATLVVERSPVPNQIVTSIRENGVTVLPAVPPLWLQLLGVSSFAKPIPSVRAMTNTGGRIPVDGVRSLRAYQPHARLFLMYGLTEAFRATYLPPELTDEHPDSIGRAIPGSEIMVVREDGSLCAPGEVGELVQRGPTVSLGYWNNPEATAKVFRPNPCRPAGTPDAERVVFSGDLVRRDENGLLYFLGRRDTLIKSLGYRVSPDEIVDALFASGEIVEGIVATEPEALRGDLIVAVVVLKESGSLQRLEAFCRVELPRHMQPGRFEVRSYIPRVSSGKYDLVGARAQLAEPSAVS